MAKFSLGVLWSNGSGKIGNVVVNKGSDGEVTVRERVKPRNPKSAGQTNVRGAFKTSSGAFKNMPGLDASLWDAHGKTLKGKDGKPLSGIAAYNRYAIVYRLIHPGGTPPVAPPATDYLGDGFAVTATAGANKVSFVGADNTDTSSVVECLLQELPAGNSKPAADGYRTVAYATFTDGNDNTFVANVGPGRYAAAYRFCDKATGQQTPLVQLSVLGVTLEVVAGGEAEKPASRKKAA